MADAELQAMYEEFEGSNPQHVSRKSSISQKETQERIAQYVEDQAQQNAFFSEENYPKPNVKLVATNDNQGYSSPPGRSLLFTSK